MKKILITLFLILSAITSAQNFFPTKPGDAYQFLNFDFTEYPGVYFEHTSYSSVIATQYLYQNQTYVKIGNRICRLDSISNKLYILTNGEEKLAFDFNKPAGATDTLYFNYGIYTYDEGFINIFGEQRFYKEIYSFEPPFYKAFTFVEGIGYYKYFDRFYDGSIRIVKDFKVISAIIDNTIYNQFSIEIIPNFPSELSPTISNYTIPVDIISPYFGLVDYLAADVVVFAGGTQIYQETFYGNIEQEKIDLNLSHSILSQADSVGFRVICKDSSIFNNQAYAPESGYYFIPLIEELMWTLLVPGINPDFNRCMKFFTPDIGIIFGADWVGIDPNQFTVGIEFKTMNSGISFNMQYLDPSNSYAQEFKVVDQNTAFIIFGDWVYKTSDQGETWFSVHSHPDNPFAINLSFINADTVWFSGRKFMTSYAIPKIYRTYDGGQNWEAFNTTLQEAFMLIDFAAVNDGYAVAQSGKIYRSADGGETWQFTNATIANQKELNMFPEGKGWLTGNGIWRTEDGGINWTQQFAGNFVDAHFFNADKGWVIGTANGNNVLLFTSNGGADWNEIEVQEMGGDYLYLDFVDESHGWIYSANKRLLKTTNGGVTFVDDERFQNVQPTEFALSQNYPNPFNPSTTISWQSPVGSWQTIKLFNALGQEVDTIVDEYLPAGFHSKLYIVNSTLPSGVYFYQLKAGDYFETKKMLLIK